MRDRQRLSSLAASGQSRKAGCADIAGRSNQCGAGGQIHREGKTRLAGIQGGRGTGIGGKQAGHEEIGDDSRDLLARKLTAFAIPDANPVMRAEDGFGDDVGVDFAEFAGV